MKRRKKTIDVRKLSEHPVSAIEELANAGVISPRPQYTFERDRYGHCRALIRYKDGIHNWGEGENKTEAKRAAAAGMLKWLLENVVCICPTPKKIRFATKEAAWDFINAHKALDRSEFSRPYDDCRCGWVHISSRFGRG